MEKNCLYCEKYFTTARSNKKYCSDNCKQMAYFKRNGFALARVEGGFPPANTLIKEPNLLLAYESELKKAGNVKDTSPIQEEDKSQEILFDRLMEAFDEKLEKVKCELSVKYDTFLHPYFTESENVKDVLQSQDGNANEEAHPLVEGLTPLNENKEEKEYVWIQPKLISGIEKNYGNGMGGRIFKEAQKYFDYEDAQGVLWLNIRLRCLIESLIKVSNLGHIDKQTLLCLIDAFERLIHSDTYQCLVSVYPFSKLIRELCLNVNHSAKENEGKEKVKLFLTAEHKAYLIGLRYQMLQYVPQMKFSEMDFEDAFLFET